MKLTLFSLSSYLFMQKARIALELRTDSLTATAAIKAAAEALGKKVKTTGSTAALP